MSTRFFSGFSLANDASFFDAFLTKNDYAIAGFSYGAIKAAEQVAASHTRVDLLQLFSPAFFQNRPEKFKRLQLMAFKKDAPAYLRQFRENCFAPHGELEVEEGEATAEGLETLLYYEWEPELLHKIMAKGTRIEVYLGEEDKIIDANAAREFFLPYATVFTIKHANHFLKDSDSE